MSDPQPNPAAHGGEGHLFAPAGPTPWAAGAAAVELERAQADEGLLAWMATVDHKRVGLLYLLTSLGFFLVGGLEALLMRTQLALPGSTFLGPAVYNQLFTLHGTTMIFLVIMPAVIGFANYVVPLQLGARDVAYPRLNALSYWLFLFGGLLLYYSFLHGGAPDAGWTGYPPLAARPYSSSYGMDYWALGLLVTGIGSIAGALNLIVTIATLRAPGMSYGRMPLFVWTVLVTAFLIIWAMPTLTAAAVMLVLDRNLGAVFFLPRFGGDPVLYQHLFWWLGHPEVYIMFLPVTGMISEIVPVFARKPIFGYPFLAGSTVFIGFYSMFVWAHHMLAVGMPHLALGFFSGASLLIALPTGVKIFNWLATMYGGSLRFSTALLFAIGLVVNFTLGGLTGVMVALVPFDWQVTDSYFVVAHLHYVLVGGSLAGLFAGTYYWFPKITGRFLDERLGRWHFGTFIVGLTLTFLPMHYLGLIGMPRRVYTFPADAGLTELNLIVTVGAYLQGVSVLIFLANLVRSLRQGAPAGPNPWDAPSLEWSVPSPPPPENFAATPTVRSRFPLWERAERSADAHPAERSAGAHPAGPVGPHRSQAAAGVRLGMLLFISSEAVFFGSLIITYLVHRGGTGSAAAELLDVPKTFLFSLALFASSGTVWFADRRHARGDAGGFRRWVLVTIALGATFLFGQLAEYRKLLLEQINLSAGVFGSTFFTLTGFHGLHVLGGLIMLALLALVAGRRRYAARSGPAVAAVSLYWHFVDAVWVVIFGVVYLWTLLR